MTSQLGWNDKSARFHASYNSSLCCSQFPALIDPLRTWGICCTRILRDCIPWSCRLGRRMCFIRRRARKSAAAALLLDVDPVRLVRGKRGQHEGGTLDQYVNDRPYVLSSFLSVAMGRYPNGSNNSRINSEPPRQATTASLAVKGIAWSASSCLPLLRPDIAVPNASGSGLSSSANCASASRASCLAATNGSVPPSLFLVRSSVPPPQDNALRSPPY